MFKKTLLILFILFFAIFLFPDCRSSESPKVDNKVHVSFNCNGEERTYLIHIPPVPSNKPFPLVIVLHGLGGTGEQICRYTGFNEIADREGFIAIYPDGIIFKKTALREIRGWRLIKNEDVNFISALIDKVSKEYNIDPERIYATGISNGGMMSLLLAAKLSDKISAIASVAASLGKAQLMSLPEGNPVSTIIMNGTSDTVVPWDGGYIDVFGLKLGKVVSCEDLVKYWVTRNECSNNPEITYEEDKDENDGTRVKKEIYTSEDKKTEVILYVIEGGGHTWPGASIGAERFGKISKDINGSEVIWDFFKRHIKEP